MYASSVALVLFSTFLSTTLAQDSSEPSPLATLRTNWEQALQRSAEPLNQTYREELEKLKATFTESGDSEALNAVEKEIERVTLQSQFEDRFAKFEGFQRFAGIWDWSTRSNEILIIHADGTGSHNIHGEFEVQRVEPTAIEVTFPDSPFAPLPCRFQWKSKDKLERIRLSPETNEHLRVNRGEMARKEE